MMNVLIGNHTPALAPLPRDLIQGIKEDPNPSRHSELPLITEPQHMITTKERPWPLDPEPDLNLGINSEA